MFLKKNIENIANKIKNCNFIYNTQIINIATAIVNYLLFINYVREKLHEIKVQLETLVFKINGFVQPTII